MGDENISGGAVFDGNVALKVLKYIGLIPVILLFAICLTVLPLIGSVDNALSTNVSSDVIEVALKEGTAEYPEIFDLIEVNCMTEEDLSFGNYTVPCEIFVDSNNWTPVAEYIVDAYPSSYYELVPEEQMPFDVPSVINGVAKPTLYVLVIVSILLMVLFAKGNINSSLNYLSIGLFTAGIVYLVTKVVLLSVLISSGLPDFVSSILPHYLPSAFLGILYIVLAIVTKLVGVSIKLLRK